MSNTSELDNNLSVCANCGKGEEDSIKLKACTACKLVKYCNRECQIAHRPKHKQDCKRRAAELQDEKLFEQPPLPPQDCPICMIRLPLIFTGRKYMTCCGKIICSGCVYAYQLRAVTAGRIEEDDICPFCRSPPTDDDDEKVKRLNKRMDMNDANAIHYIGCNLDFMGLPQNFAKELELWHRAAELGNTNAYYNIGCCYDYGDGVEVDLKKANHYYELAAMGGEVHARHRLGVLEAQAGQKDRALKHFMIAAKDGFFNSLKIIEVIYEKGHATKDDFCKALRSYQSYLDEIKSDQRDEAAAYDDANKYYLTRGVDDL